MDIFPILTCILLKFFIFLFSIAVDKQETTCYNLVTFMGGQYMAGKNDLSGALEFRGHPLRRKDNLIYYGSMADKYIIMLQVISSKKEDDMDVANKVIVQLQYTDPDLKSRDRVVKKTEKESLYAAMDVASVWLERALSTK